MKLFKYGLPFAALALLASCANDNVGEPSNPNLPLDEDATNVAFNIQMVAAPGTRVDNAYADGEAQEYAVRNGHVYIFSASTGSEADATFVTDAELKVPADWSLYGTTTDYVTTTGVVKANLSNVPTSGNFWIAMVLNYNGTAPAAPAVNTKFQVWNQTVSNNINYYSFTVNDAEAADNGKTYYTMTSAPSYQGAGNILYMAKLSSDWVANHTDDIFAATVYVQRVAAKVTVKAKDGSDYIITSGAGQNDALFSSISDLKWALDNTESSSYLFQNVCKNNQAIAVWEGLTQQITTGNLGRFYAYANPDLVAHNRIFWCEDPHYSTDLLTGSYSEPEEEAYGDPVAMSGNTVTAYNAKYCHENTFDIAHQQKKNTTRVLINATIVPKDESGAACNDADKSFFKNVNNNNIYSTATLAEAIKTALGAEAVTLTTPTVAGYYHLDELTIMVTHTGDNQSPVALSSDEILTLIQKLELASDLATSSGSHTENGPLAFYKEGAVYYPVLLRHFTNSELDKDNSFYTETWEMKESGYGEDNDHYLGRYGMVRNNWYDLTIDAINSIGEPTPPTPDDEWDDDPNEYNIKVSIAILSWAMRTQNETL